MKTPTCLLVLAFSCMNLIASGGGVMSEFLGGVGTFGIGVAGTNNLSQSIINSAVSQWNQCGGIGSILGTSGGSSAYVSITLHEDKPDIPGRIAYAQSRIDDGQYESGRIVMYTMDSNCVPFSPEELTYILTHELGHILGLSDIHITNSPCIMSRMARDNAGNIILKSVSSTDCQDVSNTWSLYQGNENFDCGAVKQKASADDCNSPLVIDMARNGFSFTGAEDTVEFDILGLGPDFSKTLYWVEAESDDAFLVRDINGNGVVDDGSELFGNGTRMLPDLYEHALNGYQGLAQFDTKRLGGDEDGAITQNDAVWHELYLWTDLNADGVSTQDEMMHIQESPLVSFDLEYRTTGRQDRHGNFLRYVSIARSNLPAPFNRYRMVDVYFKVVAN